MYHKVLLCKKSQTLHKMNNLFLNKATTRKVSNKKETYLRWRTFEARFVQQINIIVLLRRDLTLEVKHVKAGLFCAKMILWARVERSVGPFSQNKQILLVITKLLSKRPKRKS